MEETSLPLRDLCIFGKTRSSKCKCNLFTHGAPSSSRSSFKGVCASQVELECGSWFLRREENRRTRRKTLRAGTRSKNIIHPNMASTSRIEPGAHSWCHKSALNTASSLLRHHSPRIFRDIGLKRCRCTPLKSNP